MDKVQKKESSNVRSSQKTFREQLDPSLARRPAREVVPYRPPGPEHALSVICLPVRPTRRPCLTSQSHPGTVQRE
jgi:hypothetical protein